MPGTFCSLVLVARSFDGVAVVSVSKKKDVDIRCRFCDPDGDGHLFWECPCPASNVFRPVRQDWTKWSRCLLWLGQSLLVIEPVTKLT